VTEWFMESSWLKEFVVWNWLLWGKCRRKVEGGAKKCGGWEGFKDCKWERRDG